MQAQDTRAESVLPPSHPSAVAAAVWIAAPHLVHGDDVRLHLRNGRLHVAQRHCPQRLHHLLVVGGDAVVAVPHVARVLDHHHALARVLVAAGAPDELTAGDGVGRGQEQQAGEVDQWGKA